MAKNYQQRGDAIDITAPYDVPVGGGLQIGTLFGVAQSPAETDEAVVIVPVGVWQLAKVSAQAWTIGAKIYWDNSAKLVTTTAASGANLPIGHALAVAPNPSATGTVRLAVRPQP